jgi:L-cysteine:1D-myo-inositol 2-amino-2-deoxy-alpha-D-glucopyranoside ligase
MRSWQSPDVPDLAGSGPGLRLWDTASGGLVTVAGPVDVGVYVCGITPYDATHLGHAATYLTYDLVLRVLRDDGHRVHYVQNVTDVDEPLLERAERDGEDWRELAARQIELFREDMVALRVVAPDHLVGAVEAIPVIVDTIGRLRDAGAVYSLDGDLYAAVDTDPGFGSESHLDRATMERVFGENGGDPDRPGKKDSLDPLLWRAERPGEPAWDSPLGRGRPGWHIECAAIALTHLGGVSSGGTSIAVQGGGRDLIFPHHEMSASHARAVTGEGFARVFSHAGLIGLDGEKMSKSRGNLVFVSVLRAAGVDPAAVRLALLAGHYRRDRPWSADLLATAVTRLQRWQGAAAAASGPAAGPVVERLRECLADDLDTPAALTLLDDWAAAVLGDGAAGGLDLGLDLGPDEPGAPAAVARAVDALLGIALDSGR